MTKLREFVRESNRIEGIVRDPQPYELEAHQRLLACDYLSLKAVEDFVFDICGKRLRRERGIREKERRKSSIPQRKGAKSGVYEFTKAGWDRYGSAGVNGDRGVEPGQGSAASGASVHSGEAGLTGPGSGAGVAKSKGPPGSFIAPPCTSTASPEPLTLIPEPDPESWAA